jgi:hypothetical protein
VLNVKAGITPEVVWLLGDSECTLASIEKTRGALGEYFGNHVGTILDNQAKIQAMCNVGLAGEWYHVFSDDNSADQPTRLDSTTKDIVPFSVWQIGKHYLYLPRHLWPTNRDFAELKEYCIPENEILKRYRGLDSHVEGKPVHCSTIGA